MPRHNIEKEMNKYDEENNGEETYFYEEKSVTKEFIRENNLKRVKMKSPFPIVTAGLKILLILFALIAIFTMLMGDWTLMRGSIFQLIIVILFYNKFKTRYVYVSEDYSDEEE